MKINIIDRLFKKMSKKEILTKKDMSGFREAQDDNKGLKDLD